MTKLFSPAAMREEQMRRIRREAREDFTAWTETLTPESEARLRAEAEAYLSSLTPEQREAHERLRAALRAQMEREAQHSARWPVSFASDGTPTFTAEDDERKDWIHAFIADAAARVHARFHTEPGTEPERARWHWNRNLMLMDECGKAHGAYRERFGMEMPENWARTALAMEFAHHTNPYPTSTVQDMAFG